jgi:hypothetical protein
MMLLLACATHRLDVEPRLSGSSPPLAELRATGVAVAPVVFVEDLPAPPLPAPPPPGRIEGELAEASLPTPTALDPERDAAFLRGHYVGNVRFGAGVMMEGSVALQARARLLEFNEQPRYRDLARFWLDDTLREALAAAGIASSTAPPLAPPLEVVPVRGLQPDDGRDNVNLPRTTFRPTTVEPSPAAPQPWILVPYLRCYYSHNGGWFIGQQYGTMAGARVEAVVVLYDARSGRPVWSMDATGRTLDRSTATPNSAQLDQYLLWAEDDVEQALEEGLFRTAD